MKIIDLTHTISGEMPVYPGTEKPKLSAANTIAADGFKETILNMYSHTGTHTDSPAHLFENGKSLDEFPASMFCGKAVMLDCRNVCANTRIGAKILAEISDKLENVDFLILRTGWEKYWNDEKYFSDYPCIDTEAAEFLVKIGLKGIGVDAISVDPVGVPLDVHKILLGTDNFIIIENLCNLEEIENDVFDFCALPLKFRDADGAPTRAVAMIG